MTQKGSAVLALIVVILIFVTVGYIYFSSGNLAKRPFFTIPDPTPTPYAYPYTQPQIPRNRSYRLVLVGDSIVQTLGINANGLREQLIARYPENEFVNYNYGYGATNVLSLMDRLTTQTTFEGETHPPILTQGFELIIIESFGYNPLSEHPLADGLQLQEDVLEQAVQAILTTKPNVALAFMTPLAPSPSFAAGTYDLTEETRTQWIEERLAYIANHKRFAEERGIPVIDVFTASLGPDGVVRPEWMCISSR